MSNEIRQANVRAWWNDWAPALFHIVIMLLSVAGCVFADGRGDRLAWLMSVMLNAFLAGQADRFICWLANRLPRRIVYWCVIRAGVHATTGKWSTQVVPDLALTDALQRWDGSGDQLCPDGTCDSCCDAAKDREGPCVPKPAPVERKCVATENFFGYPIYARCCADDQAGHSHDAHEDCARTDYKREGCFGHDPLYAEPSKVEHVGWGPELASNADYAEPPSAERGAEQSAEPPSEPEFYHWCPSCVTYGCAHPCVPCSTATAQAQEEISDPPTQQETEPPCDPLGSCDWGGCDELAVEWRASFADHRPVVYLPVCERHARPICGIVSLSGPQQAPLACGYRPHNGGPHSWATLPTFPAPIPTIDVKAQELALVDRLQSRIAQLEDRISRDDKYCSAIYEAFKRAGVVSFVAPRTPGNATMPEGALWIDELARQRDEAQAHRPIDVKAAEERGLYVLTEGDVREVGRAAARGFAAALKFKNGKGPSGGELVVDEESIARKIAVGIRERAEFRAGELQQIIDGGK